MYVTHRTFFCNNSIFKIKNILHNQNLQINRSGTNKKTAQQISYSDLFPLKHMQDTCTNTEVLY